jgi:hypothetical protein
MNQPEGSPASRQWEHGFDVIDCVSRYLVRYHYCFSRCSTVAEFGVVRHAGRWQTAPGICGMPLVQDITLTLIEQVLKTAVPDVTNVQAFDSRDGRVVTFRLAQRQRPADTMQGYLALARGAQSTNDGPSIDALVVIKSHPDEFVEVTYHPERRLPAHRRRAEMLAFCNDWNQSGRHVAFAMLNSYEGNGGHEIVTRLAIPTKGEVSPEFLATLLERANGEARACQSQVADR